MQRRSIAPAAATAVDPRRRRAAPPAKRMSIALAPVDATRCRANNRRSRALASFGSVDDEDDDIAPLPVGVGDRLAEKRRRKHRVRHHKKERKKEASLAKKEAKRGARAAKKERKRHVVDRAERQAHAAPPADHRRLSIRVAAPPAADRATSVRRSMRRSMSLAPTLSNDTASTDESTDESTDDEPPDRPSEREAMDGIRVDLQTLGAGHRPAPPDAALQHRRERWVLRRVMAESGMADGALDVFMKQLSETAAYMETVEMPYTDPVVAQQMRVISSAMTPRTRAASRCALVELFGSDDEEEEEEDDEPRRKDGKCILV